MTQETALVVSKGPGPVARTFDEMLRVGSTLIQSGFLPVAIKTPAQAVAIIMKGRELGIPEMQALSQINIIQGKPALAAELMLALAATRYGVRAKEIESSDKVCILKFTRPGHEPHTESFTIEDAKKLGLTGKDNYNKQPRVMLRWRCVSAGIRFYCPEALGGASYTPEELGATVDAEGEVIDVPALEAGEIPVEEPTPTNGKFLKAMEAQRVRVGDPNYTATLALAGFTEASEITERSKQEEVYRALLAIPDAGKTTKTDRLKAKLQEAAASKAEEEPVAVTAEMDFA